MAANGGRKARKSIKKGPVSREQLDRLLDVSISDIMQKTGITREMLAARLREELDAEATRFAVHEGQITDQVNVVDWKTRQNARMDAHRLLGDYPAEKRHLEVEGNLTVNINIGPRPEAG